MASDAFKQKLLAQAKAIHATAKAELDNKQAKKTKLQKYINQATADHGHQNMARRNTTGDAQKEFARKEANRQKGINRAYNRMDRLSEDASSAITNSDDRRRYNALRSMQNIRLNQAKKSKDMVRAGHEQMAQKHGDEAESILDKYRKEDTSDMCHVCGQTPCNCTHIEEAKATMCGRCGTKHVHPSKGGKCPALDEGVQEDGVIDEGILSKIANKVMGAQPEKPVYKTGQKVEFQTTLHQPSWKGGGSGTGTITDTEGYTRHGHYLVKTNHGETHAISHHDITKVIKEANSMIPGLSSKRTTVIQRAIKRAQKPVAEARSINTATTRAALGKRKTTKPLTPDEQIAKDKMKFEKWKAKQQGKTTNEATVDDKIDKVASIYNKHRALAHAARQSYPKDTEGEAKHMKGSSKAFALMQKMREKKSAADKAGQKPKPVQGHTDYSAAIAKDYKDQEAKRGIGHVRDHVEVNPYIGMVDESSDKLYAGYQADVLSVKAKAKKQEQERGPVDINKLAARLKAVNLKSQGTKK